MTLYNWKHAQSDLESKSHHGVRIPLREAVIALEHMLSLTGMEDIHHGKRVAYIATRLGMAMGYNAALLETLFDLGMLHDCGVSTERMRGALLSSFIPLNVNTTVHCDAGADLLSNYLPIAQYASPIKYHHTPWIRLKNTSISEQEATLANILFFADRVDVLAQHHHFINTHAIVEITEKLNTATGTLFLDSINDAYISLAPSQLFWQGMEDRHVVEFVELHKQSLHGQVLEKNKVRQLALLFGQISDRKSRFTQNHSVSVGNLARFIAERCNLPQKTCEKIEMAGFLYNIGKMHVPDRVLDKSGPLSLRERAMLCEHDSLACDILNHMHNFGEIAYWVSQKTPTKGTYYGSPQTNRPSMEAHIVKMADVFQALIEDRPYRWGQNLRDIITTLTDMTHQAKLDPYILEVVCAFPDECIRLARA